MLNGFKDMTKEDLIDRLIYYGFQLVFLLVVAGLLFLLAKLIGLNPQEHASQIGVASAGAWYMFLNDKEKEDDGRRDK